MPRVSSYWQFFQEKFQGKDVAQCKQCLTKISTKLGSTTELKFHLRGCHKDIFNSIENDRKKRSSETTIEALAMETNSEAVVNNESHAQIVEGGKKIKMNISSYCKV